MRVGYPSTLPFDLFKDFPPAVELVPLSDEPGPVLEIDVWIPDPYQNRAIRIWPRLRGVRLVLSLMAGTEWIPATVGPTVTICNARGAHSVSTAEWTVASILAVLKHFPFYHDLQKTGDWKRRFEASSRYASVTGDAQPYYPPVLVEELAGKTVLMVGHGAIGQKIEEMLAPFEVSLIRVARTARETPQVHAVADLDTLLPQADIVILILPSTPESHHLIGTHQISLMRQGALLVNAARGPIVDTDALVAALNTGTIRAALDVTDPEPLPPEHSLWRCPNLLLTPHVAGSTPQFAVRGVRVAGQELRRYLSGEPLQNVVQAAI